MAQDGDSPAKMVHWHVQMGCWREASKHGPLDRDRDGDKRVDVEGDGCLSFVLCPCPVSRSLLSLSMTALGRHNCESRSRSKDWAEMRSGYSLRMARCSRCALTCVLVTQAMALYRKGPRTGRSQHRSKSVVE